MMEIIFFVLISGVSIPKALNGFVLGFGVTMLTAFTVCTEEAKREQYLVERAFEIQGVKKYDPSMEMPRRGSEDNE
jgi:hypothetical protein